MIFPAIQIFHIFYTWNKKEHKKQRRKRGLRNPGNTDKCRTDCIGRIPTISLSPHQAELYYLRLLLHHKRGATSFEYLKIINGIICTSFQDTCNRLGLLDNDTEKDAAMQGASAIRFGPEMYDAVLKSVIQKHGQIFALHACGGQENPTLSI